MDRTTSDDTAKAGRGLRLLVYDRTCIRTGAHLTPAWFIGANVYRAMQRIDAHFGATSWDEALSWLAQFKSRDNEAIDEIQYWGHGRWGRVLIDEDRFDIAALEDPHRFIRSSRRCASGSLRTRSCGFARVRRSARPRATTSRRSSPIRLGCVSPGIRSSSVSSRAGFVRSRQDVARVGAPPKGWRRARPTTRRARTPRTSTSPGRSTASRTTCRAPSSKKTASHKSSRDAPYLLPFFISGLHPCAPHDAEPAFVDFGFAGWAFGAGTSLPASTAGAATTGATSFSLLGFGAAVAAGGAGSAAFAGADAGSGEGAAPRLQPKVMLLAPASRTPKNTSYESFGLVMRFDGTQDVSIREGLRGGLPRFEKELPLRPGGWGSPRKSAEDFRGMCIAVA